MSNDNIEVREALLRRLSERVPGVVYQFRMFPDGRSCFPYASEGMRAIYGVAPEEVVSDAMPACSRVHPDDYPGLMDSIKVSYNTLTLWKREYRVVLPERGVRWVSGEAIPERLDDGSVLWCGCVVDITESRAAEEALRKSEARLRATLDNTPGVAVQWMDRNGRVLYWNPGSARLYGISSEKAMGRSMRELLHTDEQFREFLDLLARIERTGECIGPAEIDIRSISGQESTVIYTLFMLPGDSTNPVFVCMDIDVTERKRAERELLTLNRDLESRVGQRTADLATANKEIENLAYSVAHDLKTPLRGIDGYAALLQKHAMSVLDEEGRRLLGNVRESARNMGDFIEAFLAYGRVERGGRAPEKLLLQPLVETLAADFSETVGAWQGNLKVSLPALQVTADREGLIACLQNLLDNAVKFSGHATDALVEIGGCEQGGMCVVWVKDNGIGFDMKYHDRIFGMFERLNHAEEYPGTGVGLAIVNKAMTRMGGRAWAESSPGQGATFYIGIPK